MLIKIKLLILCLFRLTTKSTKFIFAIHAYDEEKAIVHIHLECLIYDMWGRCLPSHYL